MKDPKELRIGNVFKEKLTQKEIFVLELSEAKTVFSGDFKGAWQAEPIPLTEEILLRCGFEMYDYEVDDEEAGGGTYLSFKFSPEGKRYYYTVNLNPEENVEFGIKTSWTEEIVLSYKCNYLHQLQNLFFALTGKELELK